MDNELSRRNFLRAAAAAAGVVIVGAGCDHAGSAPGALLAATANPDGTFTVPGAGKLTPGTALLFTMPPGTEKPGIVFVTDKGELRALSAKCTHKSCVVRWDKPVLHCPCHGSKFDATGKVLKGPAKTPLAPLRVRGQGDDAVVSPKS